MVDEEIQLPPDAECPQCGCNDLVVVPERRSLWGAAGGIRAECQHCGRISGFVPEPETEEEPAETEELLQPVEFKPARCPKCKVVAPVTSSPGKGIRHHKCRNCGSNFKSVET